MKFSSTTTQVATLTIAVAALTAFSAGTALACDRKPVSHPQSPKVVNHKKDCDHKPVVTPSPKPTVTPVVTPTPTPTPTPGKGQVLDSATQVQTPAPAPAQAQPAALPQTGAGDTLGGLAGLGGLTGAAVAYIRSRKRS